MASRSPSSKTEQDRPQAVPLPKSQADVWPAADLVGWQKIQLSFDGLGDPIAAMSERRRFPKTQPLLKASSPALLFPGQVSSASITALPGCAEIREMLHFRKVRNFHDIFRA
jgi:hypothetical protein